MKLVLISDTHGIVQPKLPRGDILIHAGDLTSMGRIHEFEVMGDWLVKEAKRFKATILIAGNHDFALQDEKFEAEFKDWLAKDNITYLKDSGVFLEGLNFWGSPYTPTFLSWAFMRDRGSKIKAHWDLIPGNTDVLITHGPPFGKLDRTSWGNSVGCQDLKEAVQRVKPKLHVFGHIHEGYGCDIGLHEKSIKYVNASILNERYNYTREPIEWEI